MGSVTFAGAGREESKSVTMKQTKLQGRFNLLIKIRQGQNQEISFTQANKSKERQADICRAKERGEIRHQF